MKKVTIDSHILHIQNGIANIIKFLPRNIEEKISRKPAAVPVVPKSFSYAKKKISSFGIIDEGRQPHQNQERNQVVKLDYFLNFLRILFYNRRTIRKGNTDIVR